MYKNYPKFKEAYGEPNVPVKETFLQRIFKCCAPKIRKETPEKHRLISHMTYKNYHVPNFDNDIQPQGTNRFTKVVKTECF